MTTLRPDLRAQLDRDRILQAFRDDPDAMPGVVAMRLRVDRSYVHKVLRAERQARGEPSPAQATRDSLARARALKRAAEPIGFTAEERARFDAYRRAKRARPAAWEPAWRTWMD